MSKTEAQKLASQLGMEMPKSANKFIDAIEAQGLIVGIDNKDGAWIVLTSDKTSILARVE